MQLSLEPYTTEKRFSRPKLFHARFPLDYMLVKVIVPKRYMLGKLDNKYSHIMSTYKNNQFCRIRMSTSLILEEITCVVRNVSIYNIYIYIYDLLSTLNTLNVAS